GKDVQHLTADIAGRADDCDLETHIYALFLCLSAGQEGKPAGLGAGFRSPAIPGRERWPETSDGFRRRFGHCFGNRYAIANPSGVEGRSDHAGDGDTKAVHVGSLACVLNTLILQRVKPCVPDPAFRHGRDLSRRPKVISPKQR
ncbi:MAG: hypothetical protein ACT6WE_29865, partial [Shinella sp.]|uniref:hypothetical protein n=1 Tax=Shinella sp. TaxID=1870904 RepID=UPI00403520B8